MDVLNYDFGAITDDKFQKIKDDRKGEEARITPKMFDYCLGDTTSLRLEHIYNIPNNDNKIKEFAKFLKEDVVKHNFPDEVYEWFARDKLGLGYKKHEIKDMKRKAKIEKNREKKKNDEEKKKAKSKNKI